MRADNQSKLRVTASDLQSDLSLPNDLNGSCASAGPMLWGPYSVFYLLYIERVYYIRGIMDRVKIITFIVLSVLAKLPHHFPSPYQILDRERATKHHFMRRIQGNKDFDALHLPEFSI